MYIPKSRIKPNLYTPGNEFMLKSNKENYIGFYHSLWNGKFFTGKTQNDSDIREIIKKSLDFIRMTSNNSINLINRTNNIFINGDEAQLNRVFINLIKNSEEAFFEKIEKEPNFKGKIDIVISDNNDYIIIRLTDNGPGITDAKKAMTPYFTTKRKGTGLGLPIVTKIINEHSGNFSIKNKIDKTGLIIEISIPKINA